MRMGGALHMAVVEAYGAPRRGKAQPTTTRALRGAGRTSPTLREMGLLDGKRIVITGVLTDASIAFGVARLAQEQGAEIVLTGAGRGLSLTERTARKLPSPPSVLELDVTEPAHLASAR